MIIPLKFEAYTRRATFVFALHLLRIATRLRKQTEVLARPEQLQGI